MLKDILLSLYSRKELSFCHSCYIQISLLQLLRHQLIYIGLVWLNKVKRLSTPFHLQRKGGSTQFAVSSAEPPSLQKPSNDLKGIQEKGQKIGSSDFWHIICPFYPQLDYAFSMSQCLTNQHIHRGVWNQLVKEQPVSLLEISHWVDLALSCSAEASSRSARVHCPVPLPTVNA